MHSWRGALGRPYVNYQWLSEEGKRGLIDIGHETSPRKHIIIELKSTNERTRTLKLLDQVGKYSQAVREEARKAKDSSTIETICFVEPELKGWETIEGREDSGRMLQANNVRVVSYQ